MWRHGGYGSTLTILELHNVAGWIVGIDGVLTIRISGAKFVQTC